MLVDFSYPLRSDDIVLDARITPPRVVPRSRIAEGKAHNTSYIEIFAHTGTHIDAPWHFNANGAQMDDLPIETFVFEAVLLIDVPKAGWESITQEDLLPYKEQLERCDAVLLRTGFAKAVRRSNPDFYMSAIPGLAEDAARYLASFPALRCIGVDVMSIENLTNHKPLGYPVHHILLEREQPMLLLEDANLDALPDRAIKRMYLFPLRLEGLEASPVTAVAEY